jgi:hypothetical protein
MRCMPLTVIRVLASFLPALSGSAQFGSTVAAAEVGAASRTPPPDQQSVSQARATIRQTFKADYAKIGKADKVTLSRKLLREATGQVDTTMRYVLLREASELACEGGEPAAALAPLDEMAKTCEVDALSLKAEALKKLSCTSVGDAANATLAELGLNLADAAVSADRYEVASHILLEATGPAQKSKNLRLRLLPNKNVPALPVFCSSGGPGRRGPEEPALPARARTYRRCWCCRCGHPARRPGCR